MVSTPRRTYRVPLRAEFREASAERNLLIHRLDLRAVLDRLISRQQNRVAFHQSGKHLRFGVAGNAQTHLAPHHSIALEQQHATLRALPPQRFFGKNQHIRGGTGLDIGIDVGVRQ
jgi:hypothetical protein